MWWQKASSTMGQHMNKCTTEVYPVSKSSPSGSTGTQVTYFSSITSSALFPVNSSKESKNIMLLCKLDFVRDDLCRSTELKLHHHDLGHKRGIVSHRVLQAGKPGTPSTILRATRKKWRRSGLWLTREGVYILVYMRA